MTQEMYGATGKVGNKVYYRINGKTVAREAVTPKNPKTDLQTLQRVIAAQVTKDYKAFKQICDHSFEGYSNGAKCMNRFKHLNLRRCRRRAADIQQAGMSLAQYYNFQPIGSIDWLPGAVILSQGQLPQIEVGVSMDELGLWHGSVAVAENSYAGVCQALGLKRGDQLTFVDVSKKNGAYSVHFARIILDPRESDGSSAAMTTAFVVEGQIQKPNWKNSGAFTLLEVDSGSLNFCVAGNGATLCGAAIIASRKDGDEWLRNNAQLVISEEAMGSDKCSLYDAIEHSYSSGDIDMESEHYLNNAGVGGGQGSEQATPATPGTDPTYNNTVSFNGVSQNVAGGSVAVTAPLDSIVITGTNLSDSPARVTVDDGNAIFPAKTASSLTVTGLAAQAGSVVKVFKNEGVLWFTVNVQAAGGSGGGPDSD